MAKISVIGLCGNSVFLTVDHFHKAGETITADSMYSEIGGKGFNQAVACAKMNADVSFLGAVGDDAYGEKCRLAAKDCGLNGFFAVKKGCNTTFATILTDKNGENQVTVFKGAELCSQDVIDFEKEIASSDILLLQLEVPQDVNQTAVKLAQKHNVRIILNPAPVGKISDDIAQAAFAITPNSHERQSIDVSRFKNVITTLGNQGCSINDNIFIDAIDVTTVDTTGAGDTFSGVLAVCLAEDMDIKTACKYAVTASGMSVTKMHVLSSIPERKEIERKMNYE